MNIILASTSTLYGESYLAYLETEIKNLYSGIDEVLFIPFARPSGISHEDYTNMVNTFFKRLNIHVKGLHEYSNKIEAISSAKAYFTGGGNTFLLVKALHENQLFQPLKANILAGKPYLGCSAGSNIGGINMKTSNDMPIVYPPSFDTLGLIPYNINPHYLDPQPELKHNAETRETRIKEFQTQNNTTVIGLREGNWIRVVNDKISLEGKYFTRIFEAGKEPIEVPPKTLLSL